MQTFLYICITGMAEAVGVRIQNKGNKNKPHNVQYVNRKGQRSTCAA